MSLYEQSPIKIDSKSIVLDCYPQAKMEVINLPEKKYVIKLNGFTHGSIDASGSSANEAWNNAYYKYIDGRQIGF